jgi:OmpA-OmpF porin, OOP family
MKNLKLGALGVAMLISFSGAAFADGQVGKYYIYGAIGQAQTNENKDQIDTLLTGAGVTGLSSSLKDNPTSYGFQLGYQFSPNWAVQGGYVITGNAEYRATGTNPAIISVDEKGKAWNLSLAGTAPLGNSGLSGTARLGVASVNVDDSASVTGPGGSALAGGSTQKTGFTYGAGLKYDFSNNVFVRLDIDHYGADSNNSPGTNRYNIWAFGVGSYF